MDKKFDFLLTHGVEDIIGKDELIKKLESGKKLRIKYGVDPTRPDIHLGHAVLLWKLKALQDMGHTIIFLIGDYTAKIGDPSGRNSTRVVLSDDEIKVNSKTYFDQVGKILDPKKTVIRYNSQWYKKMKFSDILNITGKFTVAKIIDRDDFKKRLKEGIDLGMHEILYPVMQAFDSVELKSDIAFCGSDQRFNELAARELQKKMDQTPQNILVSKLLVGLDGKIKMSKSADNYIGITEEPSSMFGKVMSIPDNMILDYYELATLITQNAIKEIGKLLKDSNNRRKLKAELAREIVILYHGVEAAELAEENFNRVFRDKENPVDMPEVKISSPKCEDLPRMLVDLKLVSSKGEARRLIEQGGVRIDKTQITDVKANICFHNGMILQVGKLKFVKIRL